jgi:Antirestriction protein (ArdA)
MTTQLHATPYNRDAAGFYFTDMAEYQSLVNKQFDRFKNRVEEFEINYIDGDDGELFAVCGIDQTNIETWFNDIQDLDDFDKTNLYYLNAVAGYTLEQALDKIDEPNIQYQPLIDAVTELFDDCFLPDIPENIRFYIDYEKFARDCQLSGDLVKFEYQNRTYTCTNANGL